MTSFVDECYLKARDTDTACLFVRMCVCVCESKQT